MADGVYQSGLSTCHPTKVADDQLQAELDWVNDRLRETETGAHRWYSLVWDARRGLLLQQGKTRGVTLNDSFPDYRSDYWNR